MALRGEAQRGISKDFWDEMEIVRSSIAAGGTIKEGLHKTPTTGFVPQLFDARYLLSGIALSFYIRYRRGSQNRPLTGRGNPAISLFGSLV